MSVTREETITNLEKLAALFYTESEQSKMVDYSKIIEALEFAIAALRPVSREQLDVVINSLKLRLENNEENGVVYIPKFAVEEMIERLEAIKNG